jgi:hypothetical protein
LLVLLAAILRRTFYSLAQFGSVADTRKCCSGCRMRHFALINKIAHEEGIEGIFSGHLRFPDATTVSAGMTVKSAPALARFNRTGGLWGVRRVEGVHIYAMIISRTA